jgi:predicted ATP-grasp superfamily ATP-dependent carboligase
MTADSSYLDEYLLRPQEWKSVHFYRELLLSSSSKFDGYMLFACGDDAVQFVAENRSVLQNRYLIEHNIPEVQLAMLDKQRTLELAAKAGLAAPKHWPIEDLQNVIDIQNELAYPSMIKPFDTFRFRQEFDSKSYLRADDPCALVESAQRVIDAGIPFMVCELVPGGDDLACSCYAYIGRDGVPLVAFTKRCVRRFPMNIGAGTFQITQHLPDVFEAGLRFFESVGLQGIGNIEFKRDLRDSLLKVIECNVRMTAVQEEIVQAGVDIALLSYRYSTGQHCPSLEPVDEFVAAWSPVKDWYAHRELQKKTGQTLLAWLRSLKCKKFVIPIFAWDDLMPLMLSIGRLIKALPFRVVRRVARIVRES